MNAECLSHRSNTKLTTTMPVDAVVKKYGEAAPAAFAQSSEISELKEMVRAMQKIALISSSATTLCFDSRRSWTLNSGA
jgi:hypothetical protein